MNDVDRGAVHNETNLVPSCQLVRHGTILSTLHLHVGRMLLSVLRKAARDGESN